MIVVTTPTGHIGRQVLRHLVDAGEAVRVVVRDANKLPKDIGAKVEVIEGSHGDATVVDCAFEGATALEVGHCDQEVGQRSAEPIQLPSHQAIAGFDELQHFGQPRPVIAAAAGTILEQVALIHPRGEKRVTPRQRVSAHCLIPTWFVM